MVGYEVKKKKLTYYKCQKCKGYSLNTETRPKSLKMGGHDLFKKLLEKYEINPKMKKLIKKQLIQSIYIFNGNDKVKEQDLTKELNTVETKIKTLKIKYGSGEIDKDIYELTKQNFEEKLVNIRTELNNTNSQLSNPENLVEKSLNSLENISKIWGSVEYRDKQKLQKTIFPKGILYNKEKHDYLTPEVNSFLVVSNYISNNYEGNKKEEFSKNDENSSLVERTGNQLFVETLIYKDFYNLEKLG